MKYGSQEEYIPFNFGYNGWQFISGKLILKEACTSITFTYDYSYKDPNRRKTYRISYNMRINKVTFNLL